MNDDNRAMLNPSRAGTGLAKLAILAVLTTFSGDLMADQYPLSCGGNGSGGVIALINGAVHHVGDAVDFTVGVSVPAGQCQGSNITARLTFPDGSFFDYATNLTLDPGTGITCPSASDPRCAPGPYRYIIRAQDLGKSTVETNLPNVFCTSPFSDQAVYVVATASGVDHTGPGTLDSTFSDCRNIAITTLHPGIACTKACFNALGESGAINFSGSVTNTGNTPLNQVAISNFVNGAFVLVTNIATLEKGQAVGFSGSYLPANPCLPTMDTIFVVGTDLLGSNVTSTCSATCSNILTPAITVTKNCPTNLVQPGASLVFSGTVSNAGNVTLTNVIIRDNQPVINTPVFGPITLVPGQAVNFTNSYVVPLNSCGPYNDTLTAIGTTICGFNVTNTASATCPGTNTPSVVVTKSCPPGPVQPGQLLTITGTVTNNGNITLTNVTVTNVITVLGTTHLVVGPLTLAPGAGTNFTDSYLIPLDSCGPYPDTLIASGADKCFGRVVTNSNTQLCPGTNTPSIVVTKACPPGLLQPGQTNVVTGTVTNTGNITLTNVTVTNVIAAIGQSRRIFGPLTLSPGAGATFSDSYVIPLDSCGPYPDTVVASGADKCFGRVVTNSNTQFCPGTNTPGIVVTKSCPPGLLQPGQTNVVTGTVTNTGNITLTNVTVTNVIAAIGQSRRIVGPLTLAPGAGTTFSDSYVIPLDSCGPYPDTVQASGADKCFGRIVSSSNTQFCPGTNSPAISVKKSCPANPVPPGGTMVISGVVSNAGNITLTNVTVTNVIAAIGQSHAVFGPANLAPGASVAFTDSYTVPLNSCGPYRDTVLAAGADKCFGRVVTASDFKDCPGITTPRIAVTKHCPPNPVVPGGVAIFSGTVSNAGNITLTNVIVVNNRPTNNTPVFGPVTLLPGQSTNFTGSEVVPPNCCTYFDTLTAVGASICTGSNVVATASATCPTLTIPRLAITKSCPASPVPLGQPLVFTGTVSNSGNITLINVFVVDNQPSNNTPVIGPLTLGPGEAANFSGSYLVPINICDTNISDTVSARGSDVCSGSNVVASATAICPIIPLPKLALTKQCPANPVAPGDLLVYTGTISNAGNLTITNILIVNDRPVPNTPVLGPITLIPGQSVGFNGSYRAPYDCCGPCVDTLTARGNDICVGSNVVATATAACTRSSTPKITVSRECPAGDVVLGQLVFFSGAVSNSGNATLNNIVVTDDQAGVVLDNLVLAPSEAVGFFGFYIPTNCGPSVASGVTAVGADVCTGIVVSNRFLTACVVGCQQDAHPVTLFGALGENGGFRLSFATEAGHDYRIEFTDSLLPTNWQTLLVYPGNGSLAIIPDVITNAQRFYRVLSQ